MLAAPPAKIDFDVHIKPILSDRCYSCHGPNAESREADLPIDDSDGGCGCVPRCKVYKAWTRQNDTIKIAPGDAITDSAEAFYLMRQRGIENVIVGDAGAYDCVIEDPAVPNCITSDAATLTVLLNCLGDFDDNGTVGAFDLALLLGDWGPC